MRDGSVPVSAYPNHVVLLRWSELIGGVAHPARCAGLRSICAFGAPDRKAFVTTRARLLTCGAINRTLQVWASRPRLAETFRHFGRKPTGGGACTVGANLCVRPTIHSSLSSRISSSFSSGKLTTSSRILATRTASTLTSSCKIRRIKRRFRVEDWAKSGKIWFRWVA